MSRLDGGARIVVERAGVHAALSGVSARAVLDVGERVEIEGARLRAAVPVKHAAPVDRKALLRRVGVEGGRALESAAYPRVPAHRVVRQLRACVVVERARVLAAGRRVHALRHDLHGGERVVVGGCGHDASVHNQRALVERV